MGFKKVGWAECLGVLLLGAVVQGATTPKTVTVSATVPAVSSLVADPKLTATDAAATGIAFGNVASTVGQWATLAPQYVSMAVTNNSVSWRLRLTTKNFASAPPTTTWGYAYGGLKGAVEGGKVPLAWRVSTGTVLAQAPAPGNPSVASSGWTFIKDQWDLDEPATASTDESFATADADGYCNIAYGSSSYSTALAAPPTGSGAVAQVPLPTLTSPFKVFVLGSFNGAGATTYSTVLNFDLIYQ